MSDHLTEWMKLQEEANKEIANSLLAIDAQLKQLWQRLESTEKALIHLMQFTGLIDSSPPTEAEEEWARKIVEEGRHLT